MGPGRRDVRHRRPDPQFAAARRPAIASGVAFGATVAAAGPRRPSRRRGRSPCTATIAGTAFAVARSGRVRRRRWSTAAAGAARCIAVVVLIVILAIVIAVLEGIRVTENAALPGQGRRARGQRARRPSRDPATLIGTTDGAATLYNLFVGATMPRPRNDLACDNSLIPPWAYTASFDPNLIVYVPLGSNTAITTHARPERLPEPAADPGGRRRPTPHFLVTRRRRRRRRWPRPSRSSTRPTAPARPVRLTGNWFVTKRANLVGDADQSLRLRYIDWDGVDQIAWLLRRGQRRATTSSATSRPTAPPRSTRTPAGRTGPAGPPPRSSYVGTDGQQLLRQRRGFLPSRREPRRTPPADPVEAQPGDLLGQRLRSPAAPTGHVDLHLAVPAPRVRLDRVRRATTRASRRPRRTPTR